MENHLDINSQFIPYNLALKLKELGFDDRSLGFSYMEFNCEGVSNATFEKVVPNYLYNSYDLICTAPLYQQAFDWFREKYKFKVGIGVNDKGLYYDYKIVLFNTTDTYYKDCYNTHEEARLACLEKLIELCGTL